MNDIDIAFKYLEKVESYKYLVSIVNGDNSIEEEINKIIGLDNKAHYAKQNIFESKLASMKTKLILYWTIIRLVMKYSSETLLLKESMKRNLLITERKIIKRIFRPKKDRDGTWRIKTNDELNNVVINMDIINYIKVQRL